tara:strand:+ start:262 stop:927 length:666 start_codon:yes stop_codon:yes gene_type:complete
MIRFLNKLEKKLNLKFKNIKLLERSLTHKSHDPIENYEKLEFLGDRVLGLTISNKLLKMYPNDKVGFLDKKLAFLVNKDKCFEIGKSLNLDQFILVGTSKNKNIKIESKIISDCCESLIGAIYLDQNLNVAEKFILNNWEVFLKETSILFIDPKTKLQEYSLKKFKSLPIYKVLENSGPRHKPTFKVAVKLRDSKYVSAVGASKKEAQQKAAKLFLANIGK